MCENRVIKANHRIDFSIEVDGKTWEWVGTAEDPQSHLLWVNVFKIVD